MQKEQTNSGHRTNLFFDGITPDILCSVFFCSLVNNRSYAVSSKSGICLNKRPDSPPAGRKIPFFFTKFLHYVQKFCEKGKTYHAAAGESDVHWVKCPV
jgi:hypothetical protein